MTRDRLMELREIAERRDLTDEEFREISEGVKRAVPSYPSVLLETRTTANCNAVLLALTAFRNSPFPPPSEEGLP